MFNKINATQNFPEMESLITKFWKENKIFEKSVTNRSSKDKYIFYDGPPFITGTPHYGSLLPSIAKDVVPRYQTMKGHRVDRVWGWDCHGLPIENKVEKALDIKNRKDVEKFGIQRFVDECYKYTRNTSAEWRWYVDKIGRWVDFDNSYKTMDQDYMESVIWNFKKLYNKKLVYEGERVSLYCTRCGTPVSNFEIAMDNSYMDMDDPAVTIKFPVLSKGKFEGISILAWTTTPWTLPSNKALVLDPKEDYAIVKVQKLDIELEKVWLVKELPANINKLKRSNITQAYLDNYTDETGLELKHARIRKKDDEYTFTVKYWAGAKTETGQLIEKTEQITKEKYIELIKQASRKVVKSRYYFPLENGLTAEIDIYQNELNGLNVVEVEFSSLNKEKNFKVPDWFGKEVSDSNGIYPPMISEMTIEQVKKMNDEYTQKPHDYSEHAITEKIILAKARLKAVLNDMDYKVEEIVKGKDLLGLKYKPPFNYFPASEKDHMVYSFEGMVTMEEGTGVVHSAPGFGDIDTQMGKHHGLSIAMSINEEGKYYDFITDYKGLYVKDADKYIMEDLTKKNILFKQERIIHRYPFCYRCGTPLLQKAQPSWFIDIQKLKNKLLDNNEKINWVPSNLKHGRFKKGIEMAPDWCVSRTRYWATPMPVWQRSVDNKIEERLVIGSRDELRELSNTPITKIVFVRHGKRINKELDAPLSKEGLDQAQAVSQNFKDEKFDAIYSSKMKRAVQTIEPLALAKGLEINLDSVFGDGERRTKIENAIKKLSKEFGTDMISAMPEARVVEEFAGIIKDFKVILSKFLHEVKGKYVIAATHAEAIALIRHILEGRYLTETSGLHTDYGKSVTMYFNDTEILDLHRPKIDEITIKGKTGELTRVKEVLDVWMDSASMPTASRHYPFENKTDFEENYPADFIIEYIAQTRAWFYVMHVMGTALFDTNSFKNVVTTGVIFGTDGRKMSKSYGNYPDPKLVLEKYGADPLRLYLMGAPIMVGEDINLEEEAIRIQTRDFLLPLWNCYTFFVTYANMHDWKFNKKFDLAKVTSKLDLWILAQFEQTVQNVTKSFDKYNIPAVVKEYKAFVNELSKWYIRRSRDRFNDNDESALSTLYYILVEFSKLLAPICPFISEDIYQNLVRTQDKEALESIHLTDFPKTSKNLKNKEILEKMNFVRSVVELGQSLRASTVLKVRQALSTLEVSAKEIELEDWMNGLIMDELNVKEVKLVKNLTSKDKWVSSINEEQKISISLNTNLTPELIKEGTYREIVRSIQNIRKKTGLSYGDKIDLTFKTDNEMLAGTMKDEVAKLKIDIFDDTINESKNDLQWDATIKINGIDLFIKLSVV